MDIMGPLPATKRGNHYIVVIEDDFTKWVEAFPLCDIQVSTVASALVDGFICWYDVPHPLHTDQGIKTIPGDLSASRYEEDKNNAISSGKRWSCGANESHA